MLLHLYISLYTNYGRIIFQYVKIKNRAKSLIKPNYFIYTTIKRWKNIIKNGNSFNYMFKTVKETGLSERENIFVSWRGRSEDEPWCCKFWKYFPIEFNEWNAWVEMKSVSSSGVIVQYVIRVVTAALFL